MMENKLELKHLAPYLPYGLKFLVNDRRVCEMKGVLELGDYLKITNENYVDISTERHNIKPILRPLSDFEYDLLEIEELKLHEWLSLFENHFDVFGLIPKDLAIDINTLNDGE